MRETEIVELISSQSRIYEEGREVAPIHEPPAFAIIQWTVS